MDRGKSPLDIATPKASKKDRARWYGLPPAKMKKSEKAWRAKTVTF